MKQYKKCKKKCDCKWRLSDNHSKGLKYLNNACYLSGSFPLDCPDEEPNKK